MKEETLMRTRSLQTHRESRHSRSIVSVCLGRVLLSVLIGLLLLPAAGGIPVHHRQDEYLRVSAVFPKGSYLKEKEGDIGR